MNVKESMTKTVVFFEPQEDLESAYYVMNYLGCRHIPVSEGGFLVGIISDRDILLRAKKEGNQISIPALAVGDVMNIKVKTIYDDESVSVAAKRMLDNKIDSLVVISRDERLAGIITSSDLLALLAQDSYQEEKLPYFFDLKNFNQFSENQ